VDGKQSNQNNHPSTTDKLKRMQFVQENTQGLILKVFVQPRASKNMIAGLHGDAIKIKLTAPPVDGAANKMCIKYLAKCLNVSKSSIEIISGHSSRTKRLYVYYKTEKGSTGSESERIKRLLVSLLDLKKTA
jgi:uncharacterized protein (TIGR00251 family)